MELHAHMRRREPLHVVDVVHADIGQQGQFHPNKARLPIENILDLDSLKKRSGNELESLYKIV